MMARVSLLGLCLLSITQTTASAQVLTFAAPGDSVTLPCALTSSRDCSSVKWSVAGEFHSLTEVVRSPRLVLLQDCSLRIEQLEVNDARLYVCASGALSSNVSLQLLNITENPNVEEGKIELHCFLNKYRGLSTCKNTGIHLNWTTEDNTPIHGNRFNFGHPSECFSKLIINHKPTDHHRKWKCRLTQGDAVKASVSYTTTVPDGVEEVFSAAGESVSLTCSHTSSPGVGVVWAAGERLQISPDQGQSGAFRVNPDLSLTIGRVSAQHAGQYRCSAAQKVLNTVRLHVLDVTSQRAPGQGNVTLTCVLTCANACEGDFNLTWSGRSKTSWQSGSTWANNTLTSTLVLPVGSAAPEEMSCSVQREEEVTASKTWRRSCLKFDAAPQTLAWLGLPLGLLTCGTAGGVFMYRKRKKRRDHDAGNQQTGFGMSHVYEVVHYLNNEELQQGRPTEGEAAATDSFYHLPQADKQQ
ncbi:uncharacterized protein LOC114842468 isoform X2 [Betta splendens]|uniref:Uncharacterized protein LOC114842468 isoform X2 n=1 Tax=Betta splendens TaxID=158456 RepID=A0A9W2XB56_BETSP|nr:uncharacterized protein LOC114842468 isoform X2 [Betta splendens]